jgi:hypothetical protein
MWKRRWVVAVEAGRAISLLPKLTDDDPEKVELLLGEAHFMRGLVMFELAMFWGEIPIIDFDRMTTFGTTRQPLTTVWEYIINDFEEAARQLPPAWDSPERATSYAAWAMLGKAYMSAPQETGLRSFAKAKGCFEELIKSGKYSLLPNFADLFTNDQSYTKAPGVYRPNSEESIFELQYVNLQPNCNYWQFECGSRAVKTYFDKNSYGYGADKGAGVYFAGFDFLMPSKYAYEALQNGGVWEEGDTRRDASIRYNFTYYNITPSVAFLGTYNGGDELDPHVKKFEDFRTDAHAGSIAHIYNSGKNFAVLRYADILLSYAECLNELGTPGIEGDAMHYVNVVRKRAWGGQNPPAWAAGDFTQNMLDERTRELCFEGWRRVDLIRTNQFVKQVSRHNEWTREEHGGAEIPSFYVRFPIPDTEIKNNDELAKSSNPQNPGYK